MGGKTVRTVLTVAVDILIVIAIALVVRLLVLFFGQIAHQGWAQAYAALTAKLVLPLGLSNVKTPYGGTFDVNTAVTVILVLVAEWVLSAVRDRA